jgi:hypothetical protein
MPVMAPAEALRDEAGNGLAERFIMPNAEHPLGGRVEQHDIVAPIYCDDRIHRAVDNAFKSTLGFDKLSRRLCKPRQLIHRSPPEHCPALTAGHILSDLGYR